MNLIISLVFIFKITTQWYFIIWIYYLNFSSKHKYTQIRYQYTLQVTLWITNLQQKVI